MTTVGTDLRRLLSLSTAAVCDAKGEVKGSATFIYHRHLLTAAHVLDAAGPRMTIRSVDGQTFRHTRIEAMVPREKIPGANWPLPDLAVFRIDDEEFPDKHPCVELTDDLPQGEHFCVDGYVKGLNGEAVQDQALLSFDHAREESGSTVLQFGGNIRAGMSGGAVLDLETGRVVGVVKAERDWRSGVGGFAVAGETIRKELPQSWARNEAARSRDSEWQRALRSGRSPNIDRSARKLYLTATRDATGQSPLLPPEVSRDDLRQPVRLRSKRFDKGKMGAAERPSFDPEEEREAGLGTAFIWDPLRSPWEDVAVVAGPGMGKSWLLTYHVSAIACHQLEQLANEPELDEEVEIPVWVGAATLARHLPPVPTRDQSMEALAMATHLTVGALDPDEIEALFSSAADREKLILCVDGLDEVPNDLRSRLATALSMLEPSVRQLVVSTREAAGQLLAELFPKDFEEFSIEGFTIGDVRRFIEAWHRHEPAAAARVRDAIGKSDHLKPLTRVPLLLGFVCRLAGVEDEGELPDTRSRLYRAVALNLLSGRWRDSAARRAEGTVTDPMLRLELLSRAVGALIAGWRTRPEEFVWGEIDSKLRADPNYESVRRAAISRYESRQRTMDRNPDPAPDDVVLWEFEHDGLLVRAVSSESRPVVRFTHLVFAELCIGISLADADSADRATLFDAHRWFDDEWNDIIPIACGVSVDPKPLLEQIASVSRDPWMLQALLEARSMAEAPDAVPPKLLGELIDRVVTAINGSLRTDLGRSLRTLDVLLSANVGAARAMIRERLEMDEIHRDEDAIALAVMLCRTGDSYGIERCVAITGDRTIPVAVRAQAMKALCVSDDRDLVRVAVKPVGDLSEAARASLVSALVHGDAASVAVALEMVRDDKLSLGFRAKIAVGLIYAGADQAAKVLLDDPRSGLTVRARAVTALLMTGNRVPEGEAEWLAVDPSVVPEDRLDLIHALVLRGDREALAAGADLAVDGRLNFEKRRALARTMLSTGNLGRSVLAEQALAERRPGDARLQALLAMIERRDVEAARAASELVVDREQLIWVRFMLTTALLQSMPDLVEPDSVVDLLVQPGIVDPNLLISWERLLVQILASELPSLVPHAERRLRSVVGLDCAPADSAEGDDSMPIPSTAEAATLCRRLGDGGRRGMDLLATIVGSPEVELDTRIQAALILAQTSKSAAETLDGLLEDESVPGSIRERLVVLFAMLGTTSIFDRLLALMPLSEPAYAALHLLLSAAGTPEEMMSRGVIAGAEAVEVLSNTPLPTWTLDFDDLAGEIEFEASSDAERLARSRWISVKLRERIYRRLFSLLLPGEQEELYRVGNFHDTEATRDWLAIRIPSYLEIADAEVVRLRQEISDNPEQLPSPVDKEDALGGVQLVAGILREWVDKSTAGEWDEAIRVMLANERVLEAEVSRVTFRAALLAGASWPIMPAHHYLLQRLQTEHARDLAKLLIDESAVLDRLKPLIDARNGEEALACAAVGLMRWPNAAAVAFYASAGAEMVGMTEVADDLMTTSAENASVPQATEGRKSLLDMRNRHELDPQRIERLREILAEPLRVDEPPAEEGDPQIVADGKEEVDEGGPDEDPPSAVPG